MKKYTQKQIDEILDKHKKWLNGEGGGERANLESANLENANLTGANLENANLTDANLENANLTDANLESVNLGWANLTDANLENANLGWANLTRANLENANLTGANLDYSAFPLWCGSLRVQFDDRLIIQLLYHLLSIAKRSKNISTEIKQTLLCDDLICIANKFHRVKECGMIEAEESECKNS